MQLNFAFLCLVLVGFMAAATAAYRLDKDGMYSLDLADNFAAGLSDQLGPDYTRYLDGQQEQDHLDAAAGEGGEGRGKSEGKGQGRGKSEGKGQGRGKSEGKGKGGEAAAAAFESLFE